jgi:hypothetical protein
MTVKQSNKLWLDLIIKAHISRQAQGAGSSRSRNKNYYRSGKRLYAVNGACTEAGLQFIYE